MLYHVPGGMVSTISPLQQEMLLKNDRGWDQPSGTMDPLWTQQSQESWKTGAEIHVECDSDGE